MEAVELFFLGTGGGRFVTITQKRRTGGIRLISNNLNIHIDPGPGALIYSLQENLNPQKINGILVSHRHPDHYANAEVLVEAMTKGMLKKVGLLAAPSSILSGTSQMGPAISNYHQSMVEEKIILKPGVPFNIKDTKVICTRTNHSDFEAVGFKFNIPKIGEIGYTADTGYFEGIEEEFDGVRLLIISVMRPTGNPWSGHMTPKEAAKIIKAVKPELAVATHFGMKMIFSGPNYEIKQIEKETGIPTLTAFYGMKILLSNQIYVKKIL